MPKLLTVEELSARCRVAPRSLYRLWERGEGPVRLKIGGKVFVTEDAAAVWLKSLEGQASAVAA